MLTNLQEFRKNNIDKKIGITFSCWDLLHAGHNIFLKDCKSQCDILCVGLQTDPTIDRPGKNKPIQTLEERIIQVESCKHIDYFFIYDTESSLYKSMLELKPDVRFLGDDYMGKKFTGYDLPVKIIFHPRSNHNFSTTNLRKLIFEREMKKKME